MPSYCYSCPFCARAWEEYKPMERYKEPVTCPTCGRSGNRDYVAENHEAGMVDGETTAYLPDAFGFPKDPKNPMKKIVPSKWHYKEAEKRTHDRTLGEFSDSER